MPQLQRIRRQFGTPRTFATRGRNSAAYRGHVYRRPTFRRIPARLGRALMRRRGKGRKRPVLTKKGIFRRRRLKRYSLKSLLRAPFRTPTTLTYHAQIQQYIINSGNSTLNGVTILPYSPAAPPPASLETTFMDGCYGCSVNRYNFDFYRVMLKRITEFTGFREFRIKRACMTMRRVDNSEGTIAYITNTDAAGGVSYPYPISVTDKVATLNVWYMWADPLANTLASVNFDDIRNNPRAKKRSLKVNRTLNFFFKPFAFRRGPESSVMTRSDFTGFDESDDITTMVLPGKPCRLGWIPTRLFAPMPTPVTSSSAPWNAAGSQAFVASTFMRLLSRTLYFAFETPIAPASYNRPLTNPTGGSGVLASITPSTNVCLQRGEHLQVALRGYQSQPWDAVGCMLPVNAYNYQPQGIPIPEPVMMASVAAVQGGLNAFMSSTLTAISSMQNASAQYIDCTPNQVTLVNSPALPNP